MYDATAAGMPTSRRAASERNQRCSRISWNSSAGSRLPRSSAGTDAIDGSKHSRQPAVGDDRTRARPRGRPSRGSVARSLSRRRAWFSCTSRPVSVCSRRR